MICVVAHDAGGAEILSSYVRQQALDCLYTVAGPALKIFQRKLGPIDSTPLPDAIQQSDWLLCGTSLPSDLEWRAIDLAQKAGKHAVAFLDHWTNYRERFIRNGVEHLPDEIWVGDEDAETLVREHFPNTKIQLVSNPYFMDVKREIAELESKLPLRSALGKRVLFVCEHISEYALLQHDDERYWGYTEFDAIEYFFQAIDALDVPIASVVIRPHPSDPEGKYSRIAAKHSELAKISDGRPLVEEIADADIVVGCESMAMAVALQCGRRVISCIPINKPLLSLPFKDIQILSDLIAK